MGFRKVGIYLTVSLCFLGFNRGQDDDCTGAWMKIHRSCYMFVSEPKRSWGDAQNYCAASGGGLISIGSKVEHRVVKSELNDHMGIGTLNWWVGLLYDSNTHTWKWLDDGELIERVTDWDVGQPDNQYGDEHCGEMNYEGWLADESCDILKPFICEKNKLTPPPSTSTSTVATTATTQTTTTTTSIKPTTVTTTPIEISTKSPPSTSEKTKRPKPTKPTKKPTPEPTTTSKTTEHVRVSAPTPSPVDLYQGCYSMEYVQDSCPPVVVLGINWPTARPGQTVNVDCQNAKGQARWKCQKNPVTCWEGEPDVSKCTSEDLQELTDQIENLTPNTTTEEVMKISENIVAATEGAEELTEQDIFQTTKIISAVGSAAKPNSTKSAAAIVQNVVTAGSNLVSEKQEKTWRNMKPSNKVVVASSLLRSMENVTAGMLQNINEPAVIPVKDDNLVVELHVVNVSDLTTPDVVYGGEDSQNTFSVPKDVLKAYSQGGMAKLVFIEYDNVEKLLQPTDTKGEVKDEQRLGSQIISASLGKETVRLSSPVSFTFKYSQPQDKRDWVQQCSFWNFSMGHTGAWSKNGCRLKYSNVSHTTCECDHMTNFAILMNVHMVEMRSIHVTSLTYITYVGCIVSILCLFFSWITFQCLGSLQGDRNSIHKHLVFCLFIAEVLFLAGIERTEHKIACAIIAGFLHYFFLAAFVWMFVEGIHILFMLIQVFEAETSRLKQYVLMGYGIPLVIVGVSAAVNWQGYGTESFCWLSTERLFMWSFAGPLAFILLVNLMILVYAMSTVCKHSEYVFKGEKAGNLKGWIQGALALEVLLGLTWIFGYFYLNDETLAIAYLFTIFNSLQGLFIFVFHCLLNKKVRKEYKKYLSSKKSQKTSHTKSGSGGTAGTGTSKKQEGSYTAYIQRHGSTSV